MPFIKCTAIFNGANAGWSESYYLSAADIPTARSSMEYLMSFRVGFLGFGFKIPFIRYTQVDAPGTRKLTTTGLVGSGIDAGDSPWQAVHILLQDVLGRQRQLLCRGLPDFDTFNGVLRMSGADLASLTSFLQLLRTQGWQIFGRDPSKVPQLLVGIDANGLMTTLPIEPWGVGVLVAPFRTRDTAGKHVGGQFAIGRVLTAQSFQLVNWPAGRVVSGGRVKEVNPIFRPIASSLYIDSRKKSVGRPFGQFRGRRRRAA